MKKEKPKELLPSLLPKAPKPPKPKPKVYDSLTKKFLERYKQKTLLGEGAQGVVYSAIDLLTNETVAVKHILFPDSSVDEGIPATTLREIGILRRIKHENIVQLKDVYQSATENIMIVVFEFVDQDLFKYVYSKSYKGSSKEIQIVKAVDFLHASGVSHRDLKLQNILITKNGVVKLADFGLSRTFAIPFGDQTPEVETRFYRSPELFLGDSQQGLAVDEWSIGCVFAELVLKKPLLMGESDVDQLFKIFELFGTPNENNYPGCTKLEFWSEKYPKFQAKNLAYFLPQLSPNGLDLISKFLIMCPTQRITVRKALEHPYFKE